MKCKANEEKGMVTQFFFLYIHSEDAVSSTPVENYIHFESSGFEHLSGDGGKQSAK